MANSLVKGPKSGFSLREVICALAAVIRGQSAIRFFRNGCTLYIF
jgi:hypothetical protein